KPGVSLACALVLYPSVWGGIAAPGGRGVVRHAELSAADGKPGAGAIQRLAFVAADAGVVGAALGAAVGVGCGCRGDCPYQDSVCAPDPSALVDRIPSGQFPGAGSRRAWSGCGRPCAQSVAPF